MLAVLDMIAPWESKARKVALHFAPSTHHHKPARDYLGLHILMSVVLPKSHLFVINPCDTYPASPTCRGSGRRWAQGVGVGRPCNSLFSCRRWLQRCSSEISARSGWGK
ncbi:hypothetical protein PISMIDRAFT_671800, partial [Pisolithus microcarpus 441]